MFKKRSIGQVHNKKKVEDIKDALKEKKEEPLKKDDEERDLEKEQKEGVIFINEKKGKKNNEDDKEEEEVDVVCKFLHSKRLKRIQEQNTLETKKRNKLISSKSENHVMDMKEEENQSNNEIPKNNDPSKKISKACERYDPEEENRLDYRGILERDIEISEKIRKGELKANVYRGINAHEKAINIKKDSLAKNKYTGLYGPVRGTGTNVRMTLRVDYDPCICKDYKETGYCGFGDTCIFLHDRSDYKSGWQIEQEYATKKKREEAQRKEKLEKSQQKMLKIMKMKNEQLERVVNTTIDSAEIQDSGELNIEIKSDSETESKEDSEDSDDDDNIPFACLKCKKKWTVEMNPSVTECMHYFCESCFIEMFQKSKKCVKCGLQLTGIMNIAENIIQMIDKKRKEGPNI